MKEGHELNSFVHLENCLFKLIARSENNKIEGRKQSYQIYPGIFSHIPNFA